MVIVRNNKHGDLSEQYTEAGIHFFFMPLGYFNPLNWIKYIRFFKLHSFDTVCDLNANFAGIPLFLASFAGVNNRVAFYRQGRDHFRHSAAKRIYNKVLNSLVNKYATHILSNSNSSLAYFFPRRKSEDKRFKVIYNGFTKKLVQSNLNRDAVRKSIGIPQQSFVVGHVGRLDIAKNHITILAVASEMINKNRDVFFLFCGKDTDKLKADLDERIAGNVIILGHRTDVDSLLTAMDAFYFPSVTEGQPNALIEAILAGLPFVASNIDPIKEIIPQAQHTNLVAPFDAAGATTKLFDIMKHKVARAAPDQHNWAKALFDGPKRFEEFLNVLLN